MLCYFNARASTCVISWIDSVLSEQVRCLMVITCPRVECRSEGVRPITASTRAAPHSSGCICAGPDRSLAWDSNEWLPPFTGNYGCGCLRKVDFGTAGRGNPKYPAVTMRETTSRALPCLQVAAKSAGHTPAPSGGPVAFRHCSALHRPSNHRALPSSFGRSSRWLPAPGHARPADHRE